MIDDHDCFISSLLIVMTERKNKPFSALYFRDFRLLYMAQIISLSGTWMHFVAQGWLVYSLTESPFYLGMVGMAQTIPFLFFALVGGLLADRFKKRTIMIVTQSVYIFPALVLSILTYMGAVNVVIIMIIAFIFGLISSIEIPVRQSFLIEMVGKGHLLNAIALSSTSFHGARVIGPLIAGLIIEKYGMATCFFLNAISYIPVIYVLSQMRLQGESHHSTSKGVTRDFFDGLNYVKNNRTIGGIIITVSFFSIFGIPFSQFLPVIVDRIYHSSADMLGYFMSTIGIGSLCAGLIIAFKGDIERKTLYMSIAGLCFPVSLILFSFTEQIWLALVILIITGWSVVSFLATANSYIQLNVTDSMRGRVISVFAMMFLGVTPLGHLIIGSFADIIGTRETIAASALVCLSSFIFFRKRFWAR